MSAAPIGVEAGDRQAAVCSRLLVRQPPGRDRQSVLRTRIAPCVSESMRRRKAIVAKQTIGRPALRSERSNALLITLCHDGHLTSCASAHRGRSPYSR